MSATQQVLAGGQSARVNLNPHTILGRDLQGPGTGSTGTATYTLNASGVAQATTVGNNSNPAAGTTNYPGEWMNSPPNSAYEARATLFSGPDTPSGTLGTYQALSTSRAWSLTSTVAAGGGTLQKNCVITVDIRDATTLAVLASQKITLQSEANSA